MAWQLYLIDCHAEINVLIWRATADQKAPRGNKSIGTSAHERTATCRPPAWRAMALWGSRSARLLPDYSDMDETPPSPWQAPPPWLAARLVAHLLAEARWPLLIAHLRLISHGWRDAVADTLPALALRRYLPASEAAAAAVRFPGLRLLCLDSPGEA